MSTLPIGEPWVARALCAETDPEAFFPEKGGSTREAKRICAACDVREECLNHALANDERFGIAGGLSERERRKLKKARPQLAQTGTDATVPIPTAVTDTAAPAPRQYGMPYVGGANGGHYPLPNPDRVVKVEQRSQRKPSIDWDKIRAQHEERRRTEGTLDDQPTTGTATQLRCRWCRKPADDLVDDVCGLCRHDAEQQFTVPESLPAPEETLCSPSAASASAPTTAPVSTDAGGSSLTSAPAAPMPVASPPALSAAASHEATEVPAQQPQQSPPDVVAYCHQLLRDTAGDRRPLVQALRSTALSALAALDLAANPEGPVVATPAPKPAAATGTTTKPPRRPRTTASRGDEPDIIRLYTEDQKSSGEIAAHLHTTPKRVRKILDRAGIPRRDDRTTRSGGRPRNYSDGLVCDIRRLYLDEHHSRQQVADRLGIGYKTVVTVMTRHNIPARQRESGRRDNARPLKDRITDLGVSSRDIKTWALDQGLITEIKRGVCHTTLVDAYERAHPTPTTKENQ